MKERALLFGEAKSLAGVITEPAGSGHPARPGVLFLNAGVLPRIGPNRIHVRLARELAGRGFASMRFDFSGLGDSRPRTDARSFAEATVSETRQAMDVLAARTAARSFLLVGICSGADNALRAAGHDARVAGAALVEPYSVPARGYLLYSYRRKLVSPRSWWRLLRGKSELLGGARPEEVSVSEGAPSTPSPSPSMPMSMPMAAAGEPLVPSGRELVAQVRGLLARGASLCFVYSAESPAYFNYLSLLRRELRRPLADGRVRLKVIRETDHVFTPLRAQRALTDAVTEWAESAAAAGSGRAGA